MAESHPDLFGCIRPIFASLSTVLVAGTEEEINTTYHTSWIHHADTYLERIRKLSRMYDYGRMLGKGAHKF